MNKEELLQELAAKISVGEISREEVVGQFGPATETPLQQTAGVATKVESFFSVTKILYVLGAAIVIIGIVLFVAQIWEDIGSLGRIVTTFGMGVLLAGSGSMLLKQKPGDNIGAVFHVLGGSLIPGGAVVTLYELDLHNDWSIALTSAGIFAFYLLLNTVHKNVILTFFAIANGTATVYLLVNALMGGPFYDFLGIQDIYQYVTMAIGVSYLLLAHSFRDGWNKHLIGALYFFGSVGFLGAAFSQIYDSVLWQMLYVLIVLGGLFLSIHLKSRSILVMSTIFLLAHVSYITSEYFADSLGWPISLVLLGFVFIGLGYTSIRLNKKYISDAP